MEKAKVGTEEASRLRIAGHPLDCLDSGHRGSTKSQKETGNGKRVAALPDGADDGIFAFRSSQIAPLAMASPTGPRPLSCRNRCRYPSAAKANPCTGVAEDLGCLLSPLLSLLSLPSLEILTTGRDPATM
ncbi:hypothetical protein EG329_003945 [Mollisiaceae sp. DMI_Dod_QoI]|nr:hypothetical protein EG329_003945 [Helotiales sp. DMI_Dod_QoI]